MAAVQARYFRGSDHPRRDDKGASPKDACAAAGGYTVLDRQR